MDKRTLKKYLEDEEIVKLLKSNDLKGLLEKQRYDRTSIINFIEELGLNVFDYLNEIPEDLFKGTNISSIIIPEKIKKIGNFAFSNCDNLKNIDIPDSVTEIGEGCFSSCSNLENVKLSENIEKIPEDCFGNCKSLKNVNLPDKVQTIGLYAFQNCSDDLKISGHKHKMSVKSADKDYLLKHLNWIE